MYGPASARDTLLLAAEDAFEFERWRDAGPVTAEIDPEIKAAEIAEFEALGIPMPSELDSLRRELEHAPKVREAIRSSSLAMRRSGRASASALVALGPQQLMPMGPGGMPWGWPMGMDPRLAAAMDPRIAARMVGAPEPAGAQPRGRRSRVAAAAEIDPLGRDDDFEELEHPEPQRARSRRSAAVLVDDQPVEAEVVEDDFDDDLDDDDDDFAELRPRGKSRRESERRSARRRPEPKRARAARPRDEWDDDDDDEFGSVIAAQPVASDPRTTWILGGISAVAVLGLVWVAFIKDPNPQPVADAAAQQQPTQPQPPQQPQQPAPAPSDAALDPATGLPLAQAPAPVESAPVASNSGRRSSGVRGSSGASTPVAAGGGGGVNPFATYKTEAVDPKSASQPAAGGVTQPANANAPAPANNGAAPPANPGAPTNTDAAPPPASAGEASKDAAAAGAEPAVATDPAAAGAEPPKPAEAKPPAPELTKSKMTPAIRQAVVGKVGDLQACYQDAVVGKPDLAGQVVFTISLDQDGVVKKVEIAKDEVKYGVTKCAAKKIQRWTLPSAGIPIIFDLPFEFKP